jgi:hypothetical protein
MDSLCGAGVAQLVERVLAKHEVVGSKPITRSISVGDNPLVAVELIDLVQIQTI